MEIQIKQLRNVDILKSRDHETVTVRLNEMDGNFFGSWTNIKIPAKSYEMLEKEIVDVWLEKEKDQV